jgi:WD40 repeat protein
MDESHHYVSQPSGNLLCPICQEPFKNPFITRECNHTFCLKCIEQALSTDPSCPLCRKTVDLKAMHPNLILASLVGEIEVFCIYKPYGCPAQLTLNSLQFHEQNCQYAPTHCPHKEMGCPFKGPKVELPSHLKICPYDLLKEYIARTEQQLAALKQQIEKQANEISLIKSMLKADRTVNTEEVTKQEREKKQKYDSSFSARIREMTCVRTLLGHNRGVTSLTVVGNYLVSGSHDTKIRVWDMNRNFQCVKQFTGHDYTVWSLASHPTKNRVYSGSSDSTIRCWSLNSEFQMNIDSNNHESAIISRQTSNSNQSNNNNHNNNNNNNISDSVPTTDKCEAKIFNGDGKVYSLLLIPEKELLYSGAHKMIKVWDLTTHKQVSSFEAHQDNIWSIKSFENLLISGSEDKTIQVRDLRSYDVVKILRHEDSKPLSLAVGDGYIFMGTQNCKIKVWSLSNWDFVVELSGHNWEIWQLIYYNGFLFSGSFDHSIRIWDIRTFSCVKILTGHNGYIHALTWNDQALFSGSGDKSIKIWQLADMKTS